MTAPVSTGYQPSASAPGDIASGDLGGAILASKILIVDDLPANVMLLERMLHNAGYTGVESTLDPTTVCALHGTHRYDLIILDLQMPGMDGFAVMEALKAVEQDGYLPVLVITAQPNHKLQALHAGAKDFISKPFDIAEVLTRVHNMLEVRLLHVEVRRKNEELKRLFDQVVAERKTAERLALHIAPGSIASRLDARPDVTVESVPDVSVLVADLIGFASGPPAGEVASKKARLEEIFAAFGAIAGEHGLRTIKTLGNSFMAAAGVPVPSAGHATEAVDCALEMVASLERFNDAREHPLVLRVGIASGTAIAGVIGRRLFLYDLWGDTVNVAARMESHGVAGRIQVSAGTRDVLGDAFALETRGALDVDGLGTIQTFFVNGRR